MSLVNKSNALLQTFGRFLQITAARQIHHPEKLGMNRFLIAKQNCNSHYASLKASFMERIANNVQNPDSKEMIFTEDIKNMIYLMENTVENHELFKGLLNKYAQQESQLRFSSFKFGSMVSRAFYQFNNPDVLFDIICDEKINSLFSKQFFVYLIAMNLSYNNGKYDQVFALYEQYIQANPENQLARDLVTLVIASCYKLNTPESYERAKQFVGRTSGDEKFLSRKSIVMFSYLALLQGHLHESLEVLLMCNKSYYVARNIRILNLSRLGRFGEVMFELQSILSLVGEHKTGVLKEVLEQVRNEVERENNAAYTDQLEKLVKQLAQADCILDVTLDSCLNTPEPFVNRTEPNQRHSRPYHNQRYEPNQRYNRNSTYNNRAYNNRHSSMRNGLNEIE